MDRKLDARAIRSQHDARLAYRHRKVALVVVKSADHRDVAFEGVLAEGATGAQREEAGITSKHHAADFFFGNAIVPDDVDATHRDFRVLGDLE